MVIESLPTARAIRSLCGEEEPSLRWILVEEACERYGVSLADLPEVLEGRGQFRTLLRLTCEVNRLAREWSEEWYEIKESLVWQIISRAKREDVAWGRTWDRTKATPTRRGLWSLVVDLPGGGQVTDLFLPTPGDRTLPPEFLRKN